MSFTNPIALLLLLLLPVFIMIGYPRTPYRRMRSLISLILRLVLVTLLVLALAGFQVPQNSDRLGVVFLVDVSDSMSPRMQESALDYVRESIEEMNGDIDQASVVLFGGNAVVEQPMSRTLDLSQLGAEPITLNTDLAEAIRLGLALFPPNMAKRLVVLSDGVETIGDAESAARLAAASNVQIDYVPFAREVVTGGEVLVNEVTIPPRVNESEVFDLSINVASETDTNAELRVLAGGAVVHTQDVALEAGDNRLVVGPLTLPDTGFVDFRVQVEPQEADAFYQNNELSAFTEVRGRATVLLITSDEREIQYLQPAMEENGLSVDVVAPRELPISLAALSEYSSVVLANVSATELSQERMEILQLYVRDLGGGLVAIGGPNAYGVGGYFETPLEETLPVEMRIRDEERVPTLTMLFVLDRSGSMEMASGPRGYTNLELAKEAILRSFNFLNDYDRVGVISFDTNAFFVVDLQEVGDQSNRSQLETEVGALRPGGGTDIYGGLVNASQVLPNEPSALKHMILLTDGGATPSNSIPLAQQMYDQHGITLSVVAIGQGYAPWLQNLSVAGQGNFHEAIDVSTIPSIFAAETVIATRSYIFEEEFTPTLTGRSPILDGIPAVPSLQGYVATTEKDTATTIFRTPEGDPLLASWQYGLGRAVAFTSDANARWGTNWVTWEDYARFWGQAVRWTITEGSDANLEVRVEQRGEEAVLVVDARDDDGEYLNGLSLDAAVIDPELESATLQVPQVAPGRYELPFTPENEGAYFVRVAGATGNSEENQALSVAQTAGWVLSYSAEYELREADQRFLSDIASLTGGRSLLNMPAEAFNHDISFQRVSQPVWQYLLLAVLILLVFDIAARRLVITRTDLEVAAATVRGWLPTFSARQRREATSGRQSMSSLMEAKRRTASEYEQGLNLEDLPTPPPVSEASSSRPSASTRRPAQSEAARPSASAKPPAQKEGRSRSSLASRLLEEKRKQQNDLTDDA